MLRTIYIYTAGKARISTAIHYYMSQYMLFDMSAINNRLAYSHAACHVNAKLMSTNSPDLHSRKITACMYTDTALLF